MDLGDLDAAILELSECERNLSSELIALCIDNLNKIHGQFRKDDPLLRQRDMILFRARALRMHFVWLLRARVDVVDRLRAAWADRGELPPPLAFDQSADEHMALFDSAVFHAASFFDYFGNLVDLLCGGKSQQRLKWNGAVRAARDHDNPLSRSPVAPTLIRLDKEFVDRLYGHRSRVIHYRPNWGGGALTLHVAEGVYELNLYAPEALTSEFAELAEFARDHAVTIHFACHWLCRKTFEAGIDVVSALRGHIEANRRVAPGDEVITFGAPIPGQNEG